MPIFGSGGRIRTLSASGAARRDYNFCEGSNPRLQIKKSFGCRRSSLAAEEGFEPSQTESESGVLPLHNSAKRKDYYTFFFRFVNTFFTRFRYFQNTPKPVSRSNLQAGLRTPRSFSAQAPGRSFEESPRTRRWKPSARGFQTASSIRFPF